MDRPRLLNAIINIAVVLIIGALAFLVASLEPPTRAPYNLRAALKEVKGREAEETRKKFGMEDAVLLSGYLHWSRLEENFGGAFEVSCVPEAEKIVFVQTEGLASYAFDPRSRRFVIGEITGRGWKKFKVLILFKDRVKTIEKLPERPVLILRPLKNGARE